MRFLFLLCLGKRQRHRQRWQSIVSLSATAILCITTSGWDTIAMCTAHTVLCLALVGCTKTFVACAKMEIKHGNGVNTSGDGAVVVGGMRGTAEFGVWTFRDKINNMYTNIANAHFTLCAHYTRRTISGERMVNETNYELIHSIKLPRRGISCWKMCFRFLCNGMDSIFFFSKSFSSHRSLEFNSKENHRYSGERKPYPALLSFRIIYEQKIHRSLVKMPQQIDTAMRGRN